MKHLILGGARSGKSRYAEQCAQQTEKKLIYIATAEAGDEEMASRIDTHKQSRSGQWGLIEEQYDLADALGRVNSRGYAVLIDCLTLWISNCLARDIFEQEKKKLLHALMKMECDVFMVSNEVGSGIVPLGELSRVFVDSSGRLNQELGKLCDRVTLSVAGFPIVLKDVDLKE